MTGYIKNFDEFKGWTDCTILRGAVVYEKGDVIGKPGNGQFIKRKVLRIEKIRHIEGDPFSHVFNYLPPELGHKLPMGFVKSKPMLMILEDQFGVRANEAAQSVEATIADVTDASLLDIRVGDPLLKVERTVCDVKGNPVEYVTVVYRADKYAFTMKLKRKRTDKSIGWGAA